MWTGVSIMVSFLPAEKRTQIVCLVVWAILNRDMEDRTTQTNCCPSSKSTPVSERMSN